MLELQPETSSIIWHNLFIWRSKHRGHIKPENKEISEKNNYCASYTTAILTPPKSLVIKAWTRKEVLNYTKVFMTMK